MNCEACPCPGSCGGAAVFCGWAASGDPVLAAHVRARCGGTPPPPGPVAAVAPSPDVAEAMALVAAMKACPSRSVDPGCGCSGARCLARGGAAVTHLDCFPCLQSRD